MCRLNHHPILSEFQAALCCAIRSPNTLSKSSSFGPLPTGALRTSTGREMSFEILFRMTWASSSCRLEDGAFQTLVQSRQLLVGSQAGCLSIILGMATGL